MKLGKVIGRVTLSATTDGLDGARWLVVSPCTKEQYKEGTEEPGMSSEPSLIVYDNLGGSVGEVIGYIEGREAASPFKNPPPIDAINAALIDKVFYSPKE